LIAIDPGVKCAGVAVFDSCGELAAAWLAKGGSWTETATAVRNELVTRYMPPLLAKAEIAIEVPQIYTQAKLKGDPNDLVDLALMAGCFVGLMAGPQTRVTGYRPRQWKGQVPKNVMTKRIQGKLSPDEHERVELPTAKELQHNVWDGIGIGLHHERIKRRESTKKDPDRVRAKRVPRRKAGG